MQQGSPALHVMLRPRSWIPVALAVLLVLLQLVSPSRTWVILLCGVGGMTLAAYLWARSLAQSVRIDRSLRYVWAQVGDLLEERFTLLNRGMWPVLWAEVNDESTLPDGLPQRVIELAQEVTAEAKTPYARAMALEIYLRSFPYDLQVAGPPEGRDVVDYFLFDLQRGYCDYFASAMVVMARSVGIPARLAVGYAMGRYDPQREAYVVTEKNGHAWPELYFLGYGWIPFEPTSGLSVLERAEDAQEADFSPAVIPSRPERPWWVRLSVETRLVWLRYRWWALSGVGMLLLVAGWWVWGRRTIGLSGEERVALCYANLRGMGLRLGVPLRPCDTPAEFATAVGWGLTHRRPRVAWLETAMRRDVELALDEISLLTRVYERVSYAPTLPDPDLMRRAWQGGHRLRQRLWRLWALSVLPSRKL